MREFGRTASSQLTIEKFMSKDLDEAHDPPSFKDVEKLEEDDMEEIEKYSAKIHDEIQHMNDKKSSLV